jgi:hypothetical protein
VTKRRTGPRDAGPRRYPLAKVAWQPSHSAPWLREILADDRKNRKPPYLQFHHHIGRKSLWTEAEYQALRAEFLSPSKKSAAPPPGLAVIERNGRWHNNGTLQVGGNSRRVRKSTELYSRGERVTLDTGDLSASRSPAAKRGVQSRPRKRECL